MYFCNPGEKSVEYHDGLKIGQSPLNRAGIKCRIMYELENKYRKYLGLDEVQPSWTRLEVCKEVFYHDGSIVRKEIRDDKTGYFEQDLNEPLPEKFTRAVINKFKSGGLYFSYSRPYVWIGNIVSQRSYIEDTTENLEEWLESWAKDTTGKDMEDLKLFAQQKRCHQKYHEGDFFAFKLGRRTWGFGRIIYDIYKRNKTEEFKSGKNHALDNLLGRALIVQVYHYISPVPDVSIETLKGRKMLPSRPIFDNRFFYGDYRIIGNAPVEESEIIPLESYGRCLDGSICWYLQYGLTCKTRILPPFGIKGSYRNESIGFSLNVSEKLIQDCIAADSNTPYWNQDYYYVLEDLRNPANAEVRRRIFRHFGLKP